MIRKAENADIKSIARIYSQLHKKHAEICPDYFNMPELSFLKAVFRKLCHKVKRL